MANMVETASADRLTVQEKLLLSQAVYKLGAIAWPAISELLLKHPCCSGRPVDFFSPEACESAYVAMMTAIGINVPAPEAIYPQAKVHLRLAQTHYLGRMQELKDRIATFEVRFTTLMNEIKAVKSGEMDQAIQAELRAVLARKYGKRLLDSWVPPIEEVKEIAAGAPEPIDVIPTPTPDTGNPPIVDSSNPQEAEEPLQGELPTEDVEMAEVKVSNAEPSGEVIEKSESTNSTPMIERKTLEPPETPKIQISPAISNRSELSPPPASDLSPALSANHNEMPIAVPESPAETPNTRGIKRKAQQLTAGPPSKRGSSRLVVESPVSRQQSEVASEGGERVDDVGMAPQVDEEPPSKGRRSSGRATRKQESPPPPPVKHNSPSGSRRAASVSSTTSVAAATTGERPKRGTQKGRQMRDNLVSRSVTEQSEVQAESVKGDEGDDGEEEKRSTRAGGRRKGSEAVPSTPVEKKEKRSRRGNRESVGDEVEPEIEEEGEESEVKRNRSTPAATPNQGSEQPTIGSASVSTITRNGTGKNARQSSPREQKNNQKLIYSLLETISQHKNGNVFQNPIKKNDAPGYHNVIKRPMDLKTVKSKIRDGQIQTIEQFQRDIRLIFCNAMAYNKKGTAVYEMAEEMLRESEVQITHFRSMQHHLSR